MSLDSLARKIANHDADAFEELYNRTNKLVFSVCLGIVKRQSVAEELTQDTYVTIWTSSDKFRGNGYKSWILTIAKNKSLNYLKKDMREASVDFSQEQNLGSYENDMELSILLKNALQLLDAIERQIVLLKASGMRVKEIASFLELPRGTVSWKYSEAIKKLKDYMEEAE